MDYSGILKQHHVSLPAAFVDLTRFDKNAAKIAQAVEGTALTIRIATKSIRCPELIRRALNSSPSFRGLMCYSAREAEFLAGLGFDDFLIAYPTVDTEDLLALRRLHSAGNTVMLVVDHQAQLQALDEVLQGTSSPLKVVVEVDLAMRFSTLVVGVRRSPLRSISQVISLVEKISEMKTLTFHGVMAYEAQVAGVADANPFKPALSLFLKPLRQIAARKVAAFRRQLKATLNEKGFLLNVFNGGGTGSLSFNRDEGDTLTELTAGSGFYCPQLFSYYSNLNLEPASFFALQVVRLPEPGWVTCQGGGYVASGEPGWDRVPLPLSPADKLSPLEATGEVQTPIRTTNNYKIGDAVIFRHAKAGELTERFNELLLIENEKVVSRVKTYRGHGLSFF